VTILCYHAIDPAWEAPLAVTPDAFAGHVDWLARHRRMLGVEEAIELLDGSQRLPRGLAALTFDDGFASVHQHALPILRHRGILATVFLVARTLAGDDRPPDWVDIPPPSPAPALTRDQVLELREAGFRFGSHSFGHLDLTTLPPEECEADLRHSREILEELLREPVRLLAYPRGRHDEGVRRAAARAGFTHAFSLPERREPSGPHAIPRVGVYRGNGALAMRIKSARSYLPVRSSAPVRTIRVALARRGRRRTDRELTP
jgi:peptidoglycan/xylan/chitin deacetylase (PgdA/CDA1 family)